MRGADAPVKEIPAPTNAFSNAVEVFEMLLQNEEQNLVRAEKSMMIWFRGAVSNIVCCLWLPTGDQDRLSNLMLDAREENDVATEAFLQGMVSTQVRLGCTVGWA